MSVDFETRPQDETEKPFTLQERAVISAVAVLAIRNRELTDASIDVRTVHNVHDNSLIPNMEPEDGTPAVGTPESREEYHPSRVLNPNCEWLY